MVGTPGMRDKAFDNDSSRVAIMHLTRFESPIMDLIHWSGDNGSECMHRLGSYCLHATYAPKYSSPLFFRYDRIHGVVISLTLPSNKDFSCSFRNILHSKDV